MVGRLLVVFALLSVKAYVDNADSVSIRFEFSPHYSEEDSDPYFGDLFKVVTTQQVIEHEKEHKQYECTNMVDVSDKVEYASNQLFEQQREGGEVPGQRGWGYNLNSRSQFKLIDETIVGDHLRGVDVGALPGFSNPQLGQETFDHLAFRKVDPEIGD